MRCWFGICLFALFLSFRGFAIDAVVSHTVFFAYQSKGQPAKPYIEIYWQIDPKSLHFNNTDYTTKVQTDVTFTNDTGTVGQDHYILRTETRKNLSDAFNQNILELHRYFLPAGTVNIKLSLVEIAVPGNTFSYSDSVTVINNPSDVHYSGLQLLDTAYNSLEENTFFKNGITQIPLCYNFLDNNKKKLLFYTELYNSSLVNTAERPIIQQVFVSKKNSSSPVYGLSRYDTLKPADIFPVFSSFNINKLPSGNYTINVVLRNKNGSQLTSTSLFFQRSNMKPQTPDVKLADTGVEDITIFDISQTFVNKYKAAQLRAILKMLLPISTPIEKNSIEVFLEKPDETYTRYFIYNFWKSRNDANPKKDWDAYVERIREVNKLFGYSAIPGYETERGYIYLKYGKPNETITAENEQGALPYEVWQYNAPGTQGSPGVFLFYRPGFMINDYKLLHSTVRGEQRNTNWRNVLYQSGQPANNSRAEQYLQGSR